jgi:rhamnulose-1-phosphate aldolase
MKVLDSVFAKRFIQLCADGYARGWHERNGGNLSYRMSAEEVDSVHEELNLNALYHPIGVTIANLADEFFLVKCTGCYMRNVPLNPSHNIGIIHLDHKGANYQIVWGMEGGMKPTSELPSHLMNLGVLKTRTNGAFRVVYHCHPANLIALTYVLPLNAETFSRELWEMMTECPIIFPAGIGVVPWMVPGGEDIAIATSKLMETYDAAVWAHHGVFVSGADFDSTWGLVETIEKASEILVKVIAMGGKKQTITTEDFHKLEKPFNVTINPAFLKK